MKTVLEAVPPELHRGQAAVESVINKVAEIHAGTRVDVVNIPEIHEEPSRSRKGERRQPFAPRMAPRELARCIHDRLGVECMINHVVVHHASAQALLDWARQSWEEYGIRQFVLVGGGRRGVDYPGPDVPAANQLLREHSPIEGLRIGNICIPSRLDEAARMTAKVAAGADFFTTQILYEPDDFAAMLDAMEESARLPGELLVAFCPVHSERNLKFLLWLGVSLSDRLEQWLTEQPERVAERSIQQIERTWQAIVGHQSKPAGRHPALGINLAPIGAIAPATTIALAQSLKGMHERANNAL